MDLDEAIRHAEEKAEEHEQLADWLKELKRVRELPWLKELKELREQKRPHGEWIISSEYGRIYHCVCPRCSKDVADYISGTENWWLNSLPNFCPDCGASMISSNSETEKSNDEKSCLNCGTSECELGNRARHGFCGNWTERK